MKLFKLQNLVFSLVLLVSPSLSFAGISAIWANDGGNKVTQEELRVGAPNGRKVLNHCWDGTTIKIFGGRNEVVNFNLVLEAATQVATNVQVSFNTLTGPAGQIIHSTATSGNGVFSWVGRPIELFYIRYLQIKGLSLLGYELYDERHIPERLRRPWSGNGTPDGGTTWTDRPDHDCYYPDIAVPLELVPQFTITAGHNQSIWADIYIPKTAASGIYTGQVTVKENGFPDHIVPVQLRVNNFTLPDTPTCKTMLYYSGENVNDRFLGHDYASGGEVSRAKIIQDRYFLLAHRHKISLIGDTSNIEGDTAADRPGPYFAARLQGTFFTAANGYDGPGVNVGNNVYSVKTYGGWAGSWGANETAMRNHSDAWVTWFETNAPTTDYFLYLIDESSNYAQIETWCQWLVNNPGTGQRLNSLATLPLTAAAASVPDLTIPCTTFGVGIASDWQPLVTQYTNDSRKRYYQYNGERPAQGSFMTDDDGVALRVNAWAQYKEHINRWFYWESTYYTDYQGGSGKMNLFQSAHTFGSFTSTDSIKGETGWNYSNGDGVLFYPGTDTVFPADSYGVDGPFASLRLKQWRRGIEDHDYLTMASQVNPSQVQAIVQSVIPKVLWEYGVTDVNDPTWVLTDISWSTDPDVWEAAREQLAQLLDGASLSPTPSPNATSTVNPTVTTVTTNTPTPTPTIALAEALKGKPVLVYPNPASNSMTFLVQVPQAGKVTVTIYNIAGEVVATLGEHFNPGVGSLSWNCRRVSPGIYLARIVQNNQELGKLKVAIR